MQGCPAWLSSAAVRAPFASRRAVSFTDHDGYRFQAILTGQDDKTNAVLERRHRQRARVGDRIRDDKDTGLTKLPFQEFALNELWLEIALLAHDLIAGAKPRCSTLLAKTEPKRLRNPLLHVATASPSPAAARSRASTPAGWPMNSPPSGASKRSPRLPDPAHRLTDNHPFTPCAGRPALVHARQRPRFRGNAVPTMPADRSADRAHRH